MQQKVDLLAWDIHAVNDNGSFYGQLSIGKIFHSILFLILVIRMDQKLSHIQISRWSAKNN